MIETLLNKFPFWQRVYYCAVFQHSWNQCTHRATVRTMSNRAFSNPYPDYSGEQLGVNNAGKFKLDGNFSKDVTNTIQTLLSYQQRGLQGTSKSDISVYTGQTGIAMLYLHLYDTLPEDANRQTYLQTAAGYVDRLLQQLGNGTDVYTFLCGDAGVLAVCAVICARAGNMGKSKECVDRLEQMHKQVEGDPNVPDEHLYGRAGYLAAVMFVQSHLGEQAISSEAVCQVVKAMLSSGQALSKKKHSKCPLMYRWYGEYYLGAAHGLAGIFYTLLLIKDPQVRPQIEGLVGSCLDYLLSLQLPSGNYPAVKGETSDHLVHWCHGAPGWASMWALAFQVFNDKRYLEAAERCGEITWQRGLLKKGYGLCHGTAGNAYAFLALFRLTQDQKHLYRACKFAEWCFLYGEHGCRTPDAPFSLFEGMAGTIYFLCDLLDPLNARFPAYEF